MDKNGVTVPSGVTALQRALLCIGVIGLCLVPSVQADLGQINLIMKATLVANTCSVSPASQEQVVDLGQWARKDFTSGGRTSSNPVQFVINLEDCNNIVSETEITFSGTNDVANNNLLALSNDSTATNIGVAILDKDKNQMIPNITKASYSLGNTSENTLVFYGQYVATAENVTAGTANAEATFTLYYP